MLEDLPFLHTAKREREEIAPQQARLCLPQGAPQPAGCDRRGEQEPQEQESRDLALATPRPQWTVSE